MSKINPPLDLRAFDLVNRAPADKDAAADALLLAAQYIKKGLPLPLELANLLADGIETAMTNPARHDPHNADRGRALLVALHLEANNRRPSKADGYAVHNFMWWLIQDCPCGVNGEARKGISQTEAAKLAAKEFDISESTAKRFFREWEEKHRAYTDWVNEDPLNRA